MEKSQNLTFVEVISPTNLNAHSCLIVDLLISYYTRCHSYLRISQNMGKLYSFLSKIYEFTDSLHTTSQDFHINNRNLNYDFIEVTCHRSFLHFKLAWMLVVQQGKKCHVRGLHLLSDGFSFSWIIKHLLYFFAFH